MVSPTMAGRHRSLLVLYPALLLSGMAALVYESAWGRMLHRVFGVGDQAVATVLAAFFLGMGAGAGLGGRWSVRTRNPARLYAILEVSVGAWALLSLFLVPRVHDAYAAIGADLTGWAITSLRFLLAMAILLPPTILMGATLPLAVAAVRPRVVAHHWASHATWLYASNTSGAVLGAAFTGLWWLPEYGTRSTILFAAVASALAGVAVFAAVGWGGGVEPPLVGEAGADAAREGEAPSPEEPADRPGATAATTDPGRSKGSAPRSAPRSAPLFLITLAAASGAAALAGEVLWTRVLRTIVQGTTQAFAAMLSNYLLGIVLGSLLAERFGRGGRPLAAYGVCQLAAGVLTALAIAFAPHLLRLLVLINGQAEVVPHEPGAVLGISAMLLLPLGVALGTAVPLLWRAGSDVLSRAGIHTGRILAANTLGALFGALLAGFVLVPLPHVGGLERSLRHIVLLHALLALAGLVAARPHGALRRGLALLGPALLVASTLLVRPSLHLPFLLDAWYDPAMAAVEGPGTEAIEAPLFLEEGRNTTVTVLRREGDLRLFNDGRPESGLSADDPGFGPELVALGGLPILLAEKRERAMVVGLGAGHSATVLAAGPWREIVVVELEEAVVAAARFMYELHAEEATTPLPFPLDDPRVELIVDDARARLALAEAGSFDAIVSQPSHPWLAGSSALYTREFFEECARALRPGGVLSQWVNLFRMNVETLEDVVHTLSGVFDHVIAFVVEDSSFVLLASDAPLTLDGRFEARLDEGDELSSYVLPYRLDTVPDWISVQELDAPGARTFGARGEEIVDDRPALEFRLARIPHAQSLDYHDLDAALAAIPWRGARPPRSLSDWDVREGVLLRIDQVQNRPIGLDRVERSLDHLELEEGERLLVRGAIAEARGQIDEALALFDRSPLRDAAYRADMLRRAEGRYAELLRVAEARGVFPSAYGPVVRAAFAAGDEAALSRWVERSKAERDRIPEALLEAAVQRAAGGCAGLAEWAERQPIGVIDVAEVLETTATCVESTLGEEAAGPYRRNAGFVRRGIAIREARAGDAAFDAGQDSAAIVRYRRAISALPGYRRAAVRLMELLDAAGEREEALEVYREAERAIQHLPWDVGEEVRQTAASLGLDREPPR